MAAMMNETEARAAFHKRHRAHDTAEVTRRWLALAKRVGANCEVIHQQQGGMPVLAVWRGGESKGTMAAPLYVCAGVHGDEPAGVWGALLWAESRVGWLRKNPWLCFPCFNPWGLAGNIRLNEEGRDLNRSFDHMHHPHILAWHRVVQPWKFRLAVTLHEDYDARGLYAYEVTHRKKLLMPEFMKASALHIPREVRGMIEGMRAKGGVITRRRIDPEWLTDYPEGLILHRHYSRTTITFESPSEFALYDRVQAHLAFLNAAADYLDQNPHD